jgi:type IV secretory pathway VirB4 component
MVVMGQLGRGKSSLVKSYLWRMAAFGRKAWVFDVKGEYAGLAEAFGVAPFSLRPGGPIRLNPLETGRAGAEEDDREIFQRQLGLLSAVAEQSLGRGLDPAEHAACGEALRASARTTAQPTLPAVVDALLEPAPEAARRLFTDPARLAGESRSVALALRRMVHGDLAGIFDGPTTPGLDLSGDLVVMDLSAISAAARGLVMTCATAHLQTRLSRFDGAKRIVVVEEAWRMLSDLGVARWSQAAWKLARQYGVQYVAVMHSLTDLEASGAAGSEQARLATGLLHDVETRVVYGQPDSAVATTRDLLGLADTEAALLPTLGKGVALWKVGARSFLVQHRLGRSEMAIVDTDAAMTDTTPR